MIAGQARLRAGSFLLSADDAMGVYSLIGGIFAFFLVPKSMDLKGTCHNGRQSTDSSAGNELLLKAPAVVVF
jgi:hypothetical protein